MKSLALLLISFAFPICTSATSIGSYNGCTLAGGEDSPLTIIEFADFVCPYCVQAQPMMKTILDEYGSQVRLVFRNLPRPAHGVIAVTAAKAFAAVCLQNPSLAMQYATAIFNHRAQLHENDFYEDAKKLNVDIARMKVDMDGAEVTHRLADDQQMAEANHLGKTPSFLVGSKAVIGLYRYSDFKSFIVQQLKTQ